MRTSGILPAGRSTTRFPSSLCVVVSSWCTSLKSWPWRCSPPVIVVVTVTGMVVTDIHSMPTPMEALTAPDSSPGFGFYFIQKLNCIIEETLRAQRMQWKIRWLKREELTISSRIPSWAIVISRLQEASAKEVATAAVKSHSHQSAR